MKTTLNNIYKYFLNDFFKETILNDFPKMTETSFTNEELVH